MIRFSAVDFSFEHGLLRRVRRPVFTGLDWHVPAGSAVALVGPSGSGKSTAIRLALGLSAPASGTIEVAGEVPQGLSGQKARLWRRRVQWVPQHPEAAFNPRNTIGTSLRRALAIHGVRGADAERRIGVIVDRLNVSVRLIERLPRTLSGGEIQRFALARALLPEPELLLLDEPTSMLDMSVQAEILGLVIQLRRELGLTLVLVTHDSDVARHVADRVDRVKDGAIVSQSMEGVSVPSKASGR